MVLCAIWNIDGGTVTDGLGGAWTTKDSRTVIPRGLAMVRLGF